MTTIMAQQQQQEAVVVQQGEGGTDTTTCTTNNKTSSTSTRSTNKSTPQSQSSFASSYPFSAIIGQNDLKLCLLLCAIDPTIGGVLIRGDKGTAKSTASRGLAKLLPQISVGYCSTRQVVDIYNRKPANDGSTNSSSSSSSSNHNSSTTFSDYIETKWIPTPFVELPIGATEDRVLGSLDFAATLSSSTSSNSKNSANGDGNGVGKNVFAPGLLASANRGILYIDEVNLLPPHIVDVILDASASGTNTLQREGISVSHPAQFMLVGTMNPEEGELRPQLLDRFGLMVDITAPKDAHERVQVVKQRMKYDRNPIQFCKDYHQEEIELSHKIQQARQRLQVGPDSQDQGQGEEGQDGGVIMSDELMLLISQICTELHVASLRADITLYKASTALAAWEGRHHVTVDDIRKVTPWVLGHRRGSSRQGQSPSNQQDTTTNDLIDELASKSNSDNGNDNHHHPPPQPPPPPPSKGDDNSNDIQDNQQDDTMTQQDQDNPRDDQEPPDQLQQQQQQEQEQAPPNNNHNNINDDDDDSNMQTFTASKPNEIKQIQLGRQPQRPQSQKQPISSTNGNGGISSAGGGRRNHNCTVESSRGHYVRSIPTDKPIDLALDATLRASAINGLDPNTGMPIITPNNWRRKVRHSTLPTTVLFVVDASGSMASRKRMEAVKGACLALLNQAYQKRDRVGVIAFRGPTASTLLEPTHSIELAKQHLQRLPTGGRTPLAHALWLANETIQCLRRSQQPDPPILLVILSDGKANVPLPSCAAAATDSTGTTTTDSSIDADADDPWNQTQQMAKKLALLEIPTLMLDTEQGLVRIGKAKELAVTLQADYLSLEELSADGLVHTIRSVLTSS